MELVVDGKRVFASTGGREFDPAADFAVFLHGAGMDHTVWALQTRAIAHRGRNVLALDFPGHGGSAGPALPSVEAMADWLCRVLDEAGAQEARIAGHSMGALVALETAARGGDRVQGLALLGVTPEMPVHPDLLAAAEAGEHTAIELMVDWSFGGRTRYGGNPAPGLWLAGEAMRLLESGAMTNLASDLAACNAYKGAVAAAAKIRCPTVLLLGAQDRMTPARKGETLATLIAGARVSVLRGSGHMMMIEEPVAALDALKSVM